MTEPGRGVAMAVAACMIWGLSSLYYKLLQHVPPLEVLAHRTLWSFVFFAAILALRGRLGLIFALLGDRRNAPLVIAAAVVISVNWFLFIYSIQIDRAVDASLGYFIFPLVAVLLGRIVYGEPMTPSKIAAVTLAGIAVLTLGFGLGATPWIPLALAGTFAIYSLLKKRLDAGPLVSVTAEVLILAPVALIWIFGVHQAGWTGLVGRNLAAFGQDWAISALLLLAGPITGLPMILYSGASRRVTMTTLGLVTYLNPSLQFAVAALIFGEPLTIWHAVALTLIWTALAIYSLDTRRLEKSRSRHARRSDTDVAAPT